MKHLRSHSPRSLILGAMAALVATAGCLAEAQAQFPPRQRVLMQAMVQFNIVSGRIQTSLISSAQPANVTNGMERVSVRPDGNQSSIEYDATLPDESFHFDAKDGGRLHVRREGRGTSTLVPAEYLQAFGQPTTLKVGPPGKEKVYRGEGLWQLLITEPEACREHLIPMLEALRPEWRLADKLAQIEDELLQSASRGQLPDRRRWEELVRQLGDDRFALREAADRELRAAGPAVMPYLERLDFGRLEAEQQSRVRRIISDLTQDIDDDTVPQIAVALATEPAVWLGLLSRPEERTRRIAATQLALLLGGPVDFDPAAPLATRQKQIDRLRAHIVLQ